MTEELQTLYERLQFYFKQYFFIGCIALIHKKYLDKNICFMFYVYENFRDTKGGTLLCFM